MSCLRSASLAALIALFLTAVLSGCVEMGLGPTTNTYVPVADQDWTLYDRSGNPLKSSNGSSDLANSAKLDYKGRSFDLIAEKQRATKAIERLGLNDIVSRLKVSGQTFTLLRDGRILASGGYLTSGDSTEVAIIEPKTKTIQKLHPLCIPRNRHSAIEIGDGRIIIIGDATSKKFVDHGSSGYTSTVEEFSLRDGNPRIIGRMSVARAEVIVKQPNDQDLLLVGGWMGDPGFLDDAWYRTAEIFRLPSNEREP